MNHFVLILFWFWPMSAKALIVLQPTDANDTLINDSFRGDESISSRSDQMSVGDFNGDGLDDVAILMGTKLPPSSPTHSIELFPHQRLRKTGNIHRCCVEHDPK